MLSFEPLIAPALWLTLALASAAVLVGYAWRRPPAVRRRRWVMILTLMAFGLGLVLVILLNPTWMEPIAPPAGKPLLTILVDGTASMATPDAADGQTRYTAATRVAESSTDELAERFDPRVATFAGSSAPADAKTLRTLHPDGPHTDVAAALVAGLEENRPQGQAVLLLSDGIHNAGGGAARVLEAARLARAMACPIYTYTLGGDAAVNDLAVELRAPQEVAFAGQKVSISATVRRRGLGDGPATVVLLHDDKELERQELSSSANGPSEARFDISQLATGLYRYEIRVEPLVNELSLVNNSAALMLRVVDEPVRVLLLEGKPYWDGKFLTRTLLTDQSIQLESVVRVSAGRLLLRSFSRDRNRSTGTSEPATPIREDWQILSGPADFQDRISKLSEYQVLILGRDAEVFLTDAVLTQVREWIFRDGGSLLCYRGQPTAQVQQRLAQLLPLQWAPVREERFRMSLTERGRDLRWFASARADNPGETLSRLPTLATASRPEQPRPLAVVLATASGPAGTADVPAVSYQPYGTGRVVVIEGAGMWRWAFLPPDLQVHDDVYRGLWHNLTRWLVSSADLLPGQKLALRGDKVTFAITEPAAATLFVRDEAMQSKPPAVELRGGGLNAPRQVLPVPLADEPGAFRVSFGKLPEGKYEARTIDSPDTAGAGIAFDVRSLFEEQLDLQARPDLMRRIAEESGGAVLDGVDGSDIAARIREHQNELRPQRVHRISAWDRWWVLLGVLGLWTTAWAVRRSGGLV